MITQIQPGQEQATSLPTYRKLHRTILAACIVLAPLVILLGFIFDPTNGVPPAPGATIAAFQAAEPLRVQLFLFFNFVTPLFFPLSYVGLAWLAMKRAPGLATSGVALGLVGALPWSLFVEAEAIIVAMGQLGNSAEFVALVNRTSGEWVVSLSQYSWVVGHLLGYLLLGIALGKARVIPLWAAGLIVASVPFQMLAYPLHLGILQQLGFAMVFVGSIPATLAMLKFDPANEYANARINVATLHQ